MMSKKVPNSKKRKPYTITKPRENWTSEEHQQFLDALELYERDWKKIEGCIKTKTVIQIRSHAQKYFIKMQKQGNVDCIPPPRPKRRTHNTTANGFRRKKACDDQATGLEDMGMAELAALEEATTRELSAAKYGKRDRVPSGFYHPTHSFSEVWPEYEYVPDMPLSSKSWQHMQQQALNYPSRLQSQPRGDAQINDYRDFSCDEDLQPAGASRGAPRRRMIAEMNPDEPSFPKVYAFIRKILDPSSTGNMQELDKMSASNRHLVEMLLANLANNLPAELDDDVSEDAEAPGESQRTPSFAELAGISGLSSASSLCEMSPLSSLSSAAMLVVPPLANSDLSSNPPSFYGFQSLSNPAPELGQNYSPYPENRVSPHPSASEHYMSRSMSAPSPSADSQTMMPAPRRRVASHSRSRGDAVLNMIQDPNRDSPPLIDPGLMSTGQNRNLLVRRPRATRPALLPRPSSASSLAQQKVFAQPAPED